MGSASGAATGAAAQNSPFSTAGMSNAGFVNNGGATMQGGLVNNGGATMQGGLSRNPPASAMNPVQQAGNIARQMYGPSQGASGWNTPPSQGFMGGNPNMRPMPWGGGQGWFRDMVGPIQGGATTMPMQPSPPSQFQLPTNNTGVAGPNPQQGSQGGPYNNWGNPQPGMNYPQVMGPRRMGPFDQIFSQQGQQGQQGGNIAPGNSQQMITDYLNKIGTAFVNPQQSQMAQNAGLVPNGWGSFVPKSQMDALYASGGMT